MYILLAYFKKFVLCYFLNIDLYMFDKNKLTYFTYYVNMYICLAWARIFIFKMEISCANRDSVTLEFMVCVYDIQQTTCNRYY